MLTVYSLYELSLSIRDKKGEKLLIYGNHVCFVYGELKLFYKGGDLFEMWELVWKIQGCSV